MQIDVLMVRRVVWDTRFSGSWNINKGSPNLKDHVSCIIRGWGKKKITYLFKYLLEDTRSKTRSTTEQGKKSHYKSVGQDKWTGVHGGKEVHLKEELRGWTYPSSMLKVRYQYSTTLFSWFLRSFKEEGSSRVGETVGTHRRKRVPTWLVEEETDGDLVSRTTPETKYGERRIRRERTESRHEVWQYRMNPVRYKPEIKRVNMFDLFGVGYLVNLK